MITIASQSWMQPLRQSGPVLAYVLCLSISTCGQLVKACTCLKPAVDLLFEGHLEQPFNV